MDQVNAEQNIGDESRERKTEQGRQNPLPCGCGIKGTPYLHPLGDRGYEYKDLFIDFCPLHAAAPALHEASKEALRYIQYEPVLDDDGIAIVAQLRAALKAVECLSINNRVNDGQAS